MSSLYSQPHPPCKQIIIIIIIIKLISKKKMIYLIIIGYALLITVELH